MFLNDLQQIIQKRAKLKHAPCIAYACSLRRTNFPLVLMLITCAIISSNANAQTISAHTDTNQIRIGEQFQLNLSAKTTSGTHIIFPFLTDTFNHFEVVSKTEIDTAKQNAPGELNLTQRLTLTSFDSGYFVIPPFPFVIKGKEKNDTLYSEAMLMSVTTIPVDTTQEIKSIKNVIDVPFPWKKYALIALIAILITGIIVYIVQHRMKKGVVFKPRIKPTRPPHEIALEALRKTEEEKLWQSGQVKKYFSDVSDILRTYIEGRFEIYAMEQTTDEILAHFFRAGLRNEEFDKLKHILKLADMVKFAKVQPMPDENELILQYAFAFVNETRPVIKEDIEKTEVAS